jgi:hypothetical protein
LPPASGISYFPSVIPAAIPVKRLAILGAWAPHRDEDAYARAARRLGAEARVFDVLGWHRRLRALAPALLEYSIERYDPDFILCTREAQRLGAARLDRLFRGRSTAMWHVDPRPQTGVIDLARRCGTLYLTYAAQLEQYRRDGVPVVRFLPQAMDPDRDVPATSTRPEYQCDASFVGSGPYPYRWPVLEAVASQFTLQVRGPGWKDAKTSFPIAGKSVHGSEFAKVVRGAAASLGANAMPEQEEDYASASNRMWKIFGCGGAYVGPYVRGIEQFAEGETHCLWYRSPAECVEQVRRLVGDPAFRSAMSARAHAHALAAHTYDHRMQMLLTGAEYPLQR